ncbi:MAG: hypothetical protein KKG60_02150, partial [Nanoarchaeota archaeon]|nr:hypothetical protein [Nanoarchaeota archaeon]
ERCRTLYGTSSYTGSCQTNSQGYGSCDCQPISPDTPTIEILEPESGDIIIQKKQTTTPQQTILTITVTANDDTFFPGNNDITLFLATPDSQGEELNKQQIGTINCQGLDSCTRSLDYDLNDRGLSTCPVTQINSNCRVVATVKDESNQQTTSWAPFVITSCGDGECQLSLGEEPTNCPKDCKYNFITQLGKIFDMAKIKVGIWR